ncbi:helicase-exonuclease AddAB subunit AddA [Sutcliffiella halmapala]|uniref:helicase-exonuclease AddAB subunit AddA n=1 Tax=Sutcliffiella halmapala TaxID=79882 RepID=UPI0009953068|nr:helicase-exonuclease AddAB subunit AddA [Sutcliffiella halmapala]
MGMELLPKPKDAQWTDEQWKAIVSSGKDILVAAAAGSGKTAVLVERMIHKIVQEHVDIDRLLVVTFTNASAAEMRHRIGEALEQELEKRPASLHLRRQLSLLNRASISTIHSFCLEVVRKYYYLIDIDPSFRIADKTEIQLMQEEVLEAVFEEEYGKEDNDAFFDLVDRYTNDRTDGALQKLVLDLYEFSRANPAPELWLEEIVAFYKSTNELTLDELPFISMLKKEIELQFQGVDSLLNKAMGITLEPGGPAPRAENIEQDLAQLERLQKALLQSWSVLYDEMQSLDFPRAKTCRGDGYDKGLLEDWTKVRNKAKGMLQGIKDELFARRPESYLKDLEELAPVMRILVNLVNEYGSKFSSLKQEKGLVDFSDTEHLCLSVLRQQTTNGWERSEAALRYQSTFKEVLVDEYQDTNMVQEAILKLVTKDEEQAGNMFMVGDVKQSIYRFRLAEPFLFLSKYKRFNTDGEGTGLRIDLNRNFRSRPEVLDATNFIFKQIMGETVGEIEYDEDAELKFGATNYPKATNREAELLLLDRSDHSSTTDVTNEFEEEGSATGFDKAELETAQVEAKMIAQKIKHLIQSGYEIYDKNEKRMRPITFRDCVILMRSMPWAPQFIEEFKQEGLPLYANLSTGYFEATEVAILVSLLKIIDNPYQDVPLASVLRSPIIGLDSNELASIRIQQRKGSYFEALLAFLQKAPDSLEEKKTIKKVQIFHELLQKWRTAAREGALSELIWKIYQDTHFYDYVGGMPGGKQRQANLRALYDRARQYEATSFRGLFRFLRFIERMQDRGEDLGAARALGEQEDVIRLMTIHSSKGLEFPIVFVAGLSKQFNMMDLNSSYLLDKELGFGSKYVNARLRITYPTILQLALKRKAKAQLIAEEMRVLYVALTRAKEKLYLVGTVKDFEKSQTQWNEYVTIESWLLPDYARAGVKSYMDWVGPALVRHKDTAELRAGSEVPSLIPVEITNHHASWKVSIINVQDLLEEIEVEKLEENNLLDKVKQGIPVDIESPLKEQVREQLNWQYPYKEASKHRSKQSVSELKRMKEQQDPYADHSFIQTERKYFLDRPAFLQKKSLSPSEIGTAMHTVMQNIDLTKSSLDRQEVQAQILQMVEKELLTSEQAKVVNIDAIEGFFMTPIGKRMLLAEKVHREVPFSFALQGNEIGDKEELKEETVLVQGVIDCLLEDADGLVLIDYKTDAISTRFANGFKEAEPILRNRYIEQVTLYGTAVEKIWNKKLTAKYLYFFDGSHLVKIE